MRKINIGTKHTTEAIAIDDNTYIINTTDSDHSMPLATIRFNDETENCNGVFVNDLLAICVDRLAGKPASKKMLRLLAVEMITEKEIKGMKKAELTTLIKDKNFNIPITTVKEMKKAALDLI